MFVANATPRPLDRTLFVPLPLLFDALPLHDLLDSSFDTRTHGQRHAASDPSRARRACCFVRTTTHVGGYRFFKPVLGFAQ